MIANFFNKSKPIGFFIISFLFFIYYSVASIRSEFLTLSWVSITSFLGLFLIFELILFLTKFIIKKNNLTQDNLYPLLILTFLIGMFPETMFSLKLVFTNLFLLFGFRKLYSLRSSIKTKQKLYDAGFWVGIATIIEPWSLLFMALIYFAIIIYEKLDIKNLFVPIIGFVTPMVIYGTYIFMIDEFWIVLETFKFSFSFNYTNYNAFNFLIPIAFLTTLCLWSLINLAPKIASRSLHFKRSWNLIVFHLLIASVIIAISPVKNGSEMLFMMFPFTVVLTNFLQKATSENFKNLILYLMLGISVVVYFL